MKAISQISVVKLINYIIIKLKLHYKISTKFPGPLLIKQTDTAQRPTYTQTDKQHYTHSLLTLQNGKITVLNLQWIIEDTNESFNTLTHSHSMPKSTT